MRAFTIEASSGVALALALTFVMVLGVLASEPEEGGGGVRVEARVGEDSTHPTTVLGSTSLKQLSDLSVSEVMKDLTL
jgi:hypothetical protein